ncbi:MAG: Gfo/Idh/MocA family oxidoreductase, partial [Ignavibacteriales bacterium]|nr:Gfo/Idh/MocA family oxidoreductase [Ignavibacteriales bacterium]
MKVGILGLGYWGPNLVRNFLANKQVRRVVGCDVNTDRLNSTQDRFPSLSVTSDYNVLLKDPSIDAIAIATPVGLHYEFARAALEAGKHIWVEKPFTTSVAEAEKLIELAAKKDLIIFVDHTFIYTDAVRKIKELIDQDDLGELMYFDSVRVNLGLFQHDVNVIWDLAPHDLSIMHYLLGKKVSAVSANGIANYYNHENVAHLAVYFD